ncbi:hypothetical protein ACLKA6_011164 [Drosophila palustris]
MVNSSRSLKGLSVTASSTDNFEVMGVSCAENEEVSCLIIKCPTGQYCPAEDFCFNPKCVCRRGYRRSKGVCVKKQRAHNMGARTNDL